MQDRKQFIRNSLMGAMAFAVPWKSDPPPVKPRRFTMQLNGGLIGVTADQSTLINLASKYGFESVVALPNQLGKLDGTQLTELIARMKDQKIAFGLGELNVEFRKSEEIFKKALDTLPSRCAVLQKVGVTRSMTWIMSNHSELNYLENFRLHTKRLKEMARIMADYNIRLGLEYVGPRSIWSANNFPFIHTMAETRELISAIGLSNLGLHLDTAHWFTSGEDLASIKSLSNTEIVGCDLNDALPGVKPIQDQPGYQRELPAVTGVIDTKGFLQALTETGYDGFIQAEPFNDELNKLDDDTATAKTAAAMKKAMALIS